MKYFWNNLTLRRALESSGMFRIKAELKVSVRTEVGIAFSSKSCFMCVEISFHSSVFIRRNTNRHRYVAIEMLHVVENEEIGHIIPSSFSFEF